MEDRKEMVLNYIKKEFIEEGADEISYDSPLFSSGYLDSFSMISVLAFIENKFEIKIPQDQATPEAFESVNNIMTLVNKFIR